MICDEIYFDNNLILTVYHKVQEDSTIRHIEREEYVEEHCFRYYSYSVEENILDGLEFDGREQYFLNTDDDLNPYGRNASANMIQYYRDTKPDCIFVVEDDKCNFSIDLAVVSKFFEFIKLYMGMDLERTPLVLGDIFLFEPLEVKVESTRAENQVNHSGEPCGDSLYIKDWNLGIQPHDVIVQFKVGSRIVYTRIIKSISVDSLPVTIRSHKIWDNFNLEVYRQGQLRYQCKECYFIKSLQVLVDIVGMESHLQLPKLGSHMVKETGQETMIIEGTPNRYDVIQKLNNRLYRQISSAHKSSSFTLFRPDSIKQAKIVISQFIADKEADEIWMFDPYFSNVKKYGLVLDWLTILAYSRATIKNIVFYSSSEDDSIDDFVERIRSYPHLQNYMVKKNKLGIQLIEANIVIHDRFIIKRCKDTYACMVLGTSFNSLDSNYFCAHILQSNESKMVYDELVTFIQQHEHINNKRDI